MAVKTIADLLVDANVIKNATVPGENTATRVGSNLVDVIDSFGLGGASLPQPIVSYDNINDKLEVHFADTGFDFTQHNPEIFLFRYRNIRRKKGLTVPATKKKFPKYVHPITVNANTKWAGWKFFAGTQKDRDGNPVNTRITEWTVPSTIKPYERFELTGFNKYMYWNIIDGGVITSQDVNIFAVDSFTTKNRVDGTKKCNLSGSRRQLSETDLFPKTTNYAFALAIDNPLANQTNDLCPKIFGPFSDPLFAIWELDISGSPPYDKAIDVIMVPQNNNTWFRAARPSTA